MLVQIVSEAAMRLPEEVYRADAGGVPRAEEELTHEERRRRRAQHKRAFKAKSQQQVLCELKQGRCMGDAGRSTHGLCWHMLPDFAPSQIVTFMCITYASRTQAMMPLLCSVTFRCSAVRYSVLCCLSQSPAVTLNAPVFLMRWAWKYYTGAMAHSWVAQAEQALQAEMLRTVNLNSRLQRRPPGQ